ncbi:MAG: hypothetical protein LBR00_03030 [Clostridiales Family XIII bacterium]|jgi:phage-related protein|nr:hypothetical protein [Clostridiales Family XIII bacterium]
MATGAEIAQAYVQIVPTTQGIKGNLETLMGGDATSAGKSTGSKLGAGIKAGIGVGIGAALFNTALAGVQAVASGMSALFKGVLEEYGAYEQNIGGIKKLFGENASAMEKYAQEAYRTAGVSANEYMQNVTSFSAALISGLGGDTKQAADVANLAMVDMSDNANTFGTDLSSIQQAYQGFAKQNYTMLDNLKLGYGGTASEMARLVNESGVLGDSMTVTAETVKDVPFDKIIEGIHATQEKMGIMGTTSKEAATTLQGSIGMVQASFKNLLAGLGDADADVGQLAQNLMDSVGSVVSNVVPLIERVVSHLPEVLPAILGAISELLPTIVGAVGQILPMLIQVIGQVVTAIVQALPTILPMLITALVEAAVQIVIALVQALPLIITALIDAIPEIVEGVKTAFIDAWPVLKPALIELGTLLLEGLKNLGLLILTGLGNLMVLIGTKLLELGKLIVTKLWEGVSSLGSWLWDHTIGFAGELVLKMWNGLKEIFGKGVDFVKQLWEGVASFAVWIGTNVVNFAKALPGKIAEGVVKIVQTGVDFVKDLWEGVSSFASWIGGKVKGFAQDIPDKIKEGFSKVANIGRDLVEGLWDGITGSLQWIKDKITGWVGDVLGFLKNLFGISSPSKETAWMGEMLMEGLAGGMDGALGVVKEAAEAASSAATVAPRVEAARLSAWSPGELSAAEGGLYNPNAKPRTTALLERLVELTEQGQVFVVNERELARAVRGAA